MYNDTIKVANKIITYDDLIEIFAQMNEKLIYYKKINDSEERKNSDDYLSIMNEYLRNLREATTVE